MNSDTKTSNLPSLTAGFLTQPQMLADNLFANLWQTLHLPRLLKRCGFHKRSGLGASEVVYLLLLWVWVKHDSIAMFARDSLQSFAQGHKDTLYDFVSREDLNWRVLQIGVSGEVYRHGKLNKSRRRAYVLDDSVKIRRGKKLEGTSLHFDHLTKRTVKGQQVLTLGLATEEVFLPLDSEIYISTKGVHELKKPFVDGRSVEARRYRAARDCSKPQLAADMMRRAHKHALQADFLLADAWFGTKAMIKTALDLQLTPILRMKKSKMKYRLTRWQQGRKCMELLDAKELYQQCVRKKWQRIKGFPYQFCTLEVALNLSIDETKEPQWERVQLLFTRGLGESDAAPRSEKSWALFLTTDTQLPPLELLEIYALRWGIEVYFKEAKQHLGLLWEQTETFASHLASIHLTAIRFCMLVYAKLNGEAERNSDIRSNLIEQLTRLDFARQLWGYFQALISEALTGLKDRLGMSVESVLSAIEHHVQAFFVQALQLDEFTLQLEASDTGAAVS
jgi:hypothetical protein